MQEQDNPVSSLSHTKWNCKYHIEFVPKYRRKVFYEEKRTEVRKIIRTSCRWKGVEIIEGEIRPDHIHLLLSIPPKMIIYQGLWDFSKKKSSLITYEKWENLKFKYGNREFWCRGYYVDTAGN